ncbi:MAG: PfkB family carbohydrate kinase [Patescibacteria group bacterium]
MDRTQLRGSVLFIGQAILDDVALVKSIPTGDQKTVALKKAFRSGGNAFTAAVTCAVFGLKPDVISGIGKDIAGLMIEQVVKEAGIYWHPRLMEETPSAIILPNESGRVIISPPEGESYLQDFPLLNIENCRLVHVDGRHFDAAEYYLGEAERLGIPRSSDFGRARPGIEKLLPRITHATVSARFCDDMGQSVDGMLSDLRRHAEVGIVTLGADGLRYFVDDGPITHMNALKVPEESVIDENGSGDIFNGARIYSYLTYPDQAWERHLRFATAAVAHKIQRFGNEPPTLGQVYQTLRQYDIRLAA